VLKVIRVSPSLKPTAFDVSEAANGSITADEASPEAGRTRDGRTNRQHSVLRRNRLQVLFLAAVAAESSKQRATSSERKTRDPTDFYDVRERAPIAVARRRNATERMKLELFQILPRLLAGKSLRPNFVRRSRRDTDAAVSVAINRSTFVKMIRPAAAAEPPTDRRQRHVRLNPLGGLSNEWMDRC
jgi:hypothetical protein